MRRYHYMLVCVLPLGLACDDPEPPNPTPAPPPTASATASAPTTTTTTTTASATAGDDAPAARPFYYDRPIDEDDLRGRTLRELALMRNTIYARAGNAFRRPWLHDHFKQFDWYKPLEKMDETKITKLDRDNAKRIAEYDSGLEKEQLEKERDALLARKAAKKPRPDDAVELSLLSQRLGVYLGSEGATPLEDQTRLERLITIEDLSTLSRRDLRILRNTVYARRGRTFDSKVVRSYFETATWYHPKADYDDGMLTGIDHKNIQIIRSVEDSLGGPLHENPNYGKDGWFVMA